MQQQGNDEIEAYRLHKKQHADPSVQHFPEFAWNKAQGINFRNAHLRDYHISESLSWIK